MVAQIEMGEPPREPRREEALDRYAASGQQAIYHGVGAPRVIDQYSDVHTARVRRTAAFAAIPRGVHGPLFRSLSELLVNACKHSAATEITISAELAAHGEIRIEVADNGRGFDHSRRGTGFGLLGVERRMACLRGALELRSAPERGTIATLRLSALQ